MKLAVVSDIHGNLEAFRQVLSDIDQAGISRIFCLGDIVGYGPEPELVVRLLRSRQIPSIMGNHELALTSEKYFLKLNADTQKSLQITKRLLSKESVHYLRSLQPATVFHGARFVHGCPPDSSTIYLFQPSIIQLQTIFSYFKENVCFIGHTHNLSIFSFDGQAARRKEAPEGKHVLVRERRYIINIGSVGQPRDSHNRHAKYVIWDTDANIVEVRFIPYNRSITVEKIIKLGFPEANATRLW